MASRQPPAHAFYDARSLVFHREIAARLRADPALLDIAKTTLARWSAQSPNRPADVEWAAILARGVEVVIAIIESDDQEGQRLRQSSPLLSILPLREREAMRVAFAARASEFARTDIPWQQLVADARDSTLLAIEDLHACGFSAFSGGTGANAGKVYEHTPDGKVFEVVLKGDSHERIQECE